MGCWKGWVQKPVHTGFTIRIHKGWLKSILTIHIKPLIHLLLALDAPCLWLQLAVFVNKASEAFEANLGHAHKLRRTDRGDSVEYIDIHDSTPFCRKSQDANVAWVDSYSALFGLQISYSKWWKITTYKQPLLQRSLLEAMSMFRFLDADAISASLAVRGLVFQNVRVDFWPN